MNDVQEILVIYDKHCPACDYYCTLLRIRETVGNLVLVDAREGGPVMDEITAHGLDIDQGMVVKVGNEFYYGPEAIPVLALMGTNQGFFNRLAYWSFRSKPTALTFLWMGNVHHNLRLLVELGKRALGQSGRVRAMMVEEFGSYEVIGMQRSLECNAVWWRDGACVARVVEDPPKQLPGPTQSWRWWFCRREEPQSLFAIPVYKALR